MESSRSRTARLALVVLALGLVAAMQLLASQPPAAPAGPAVGPVVKPA